MTHLDWVGLPWTSDRPVALATTHNKQKRQTRSPSKRDATGIGSHSICGVQSRMFARSPCFFHVTRTFMAHRRTRNHMFIRPTARSLLLERYTTITTYHSRIWPPKSCRKLQTMALRYPSVTSNLHQLSCTCVSRTNALAVSRCYNHFSLLRTEIRLEVLSSVTPPQHAHTVQRNANSACECSPRSDYLPTH